jgi:hypothetical protein
VAPYLLFCYNSQLKDVGDIMNCIEMKTLKGTKTIRGLDNLLTATSEKLSLEASIAIAFILFAKAVLST